MSVSGWSRRGPHRVAFGNGEGFPAAVVVRTAVRVPELSPTSLVTPTTLEPLRGQCRIMCEPEGETSCLPQCRGLGAARRDRSEGSSGPLAGFAEEGPGLRAPSSC